MEKEQNRKFYFDLIEFCLLINAHFFCFARIEKPFESYSYSFKIKVVFLTHALIKVLIIFIYDHHDSCIYLDGILR